MLNTCNSNSIFVPVSYLAVLQDLIMQHDKDTAPNKEFLAGIECKFSFGGNSQEMLLVTVNYWIFPQHLFNSLNDCEKFAQFFLDMGLPCVDDDCFIMSSATSLDGNPLQRVYYQNNWLSLIN